MILVLIWIVDRYPPGKKGQKEYVSTSSSKKKDYRGFGLLWSVATTSIVKTSVFVAANKKKKSKKEENVLLEIGLCS